MTAPTDPQSKPLAEAREEALARLAALPAIFRKAGTHHVIEDDVRETVQLVRDLIEADGKRLAELDEIESVMIARGARLDAAEAALARISASPAPETNALRDALGLAEKALAPFAAAARQFVERDDEAWVDLLTSPGEVRAAVTALAAIHAALHTGGEGTPTPERDTATEPVPSTLEGGSRSGTGGEGKGETDQTVTCHALAITRLRAVLQQITVYIVEGSEQYVHLKIGEWDTEIEADKAGAVLAFDAAQRAALHTPSPTPAPATGDEIITMEMMMAGINASPAWLMAVRNGGDFAPVPSSYYRRQHQSLDTGEVAAIYRAMRAAQPPVPPATADQVNAACAAFYGPDEWDRMSERGTEPEQIRMTRALRAAVRPKDAGAKP